MDAKITKQRLGNMLAYDWIKILCAIAAAVVVVVLIFTMVGTTPTRAQKFYVHFYGDGNYVYGDDYSLLEDYLDSRLSYDILYTVVEDFDSSDYTSSAAYTARRASGEGTVLVAANYSADEDTTPFESIVTTGMSSPGEWNEQLNMFYRLDEYFTSLEVYLTRFFGEDWRANDEIDSAAAEECFRARNVDGSNNRHRYTTEEEITEGIEDEKARLNTLRSDYLYLLDKGLGEENGLPFVTYTSEVTLLDGTSEEREYVCGICIGKLQNIDKLVCYKDADGNAARRELVFLVYNNDGALRPEEDDFTYEVALGDALGDMRFEAVTFLRFLAEQYS